MRRSIAVPLLCALLLGGCAGGSSLPDSAAPAGSASQGESSLAASASGSAPGAESGAKSASSSAPPLSPASGEVLEIKEKMFIAQINDIYLNAQDYFGKTIRYEGLFKSTYWPEEGKTYYFVIRYGPGCCSYDGEAGFEVAWDGPLPQEDDWCEAVGVLELYEEGDISYLRLALTSLTVLDERGAEYVAQ